MTITAADASSNVVPYPDQALYLALRGADQAAVMQALWIYDRPLDIDGVRRFHRNLHHGLLGRRIETSPLPFGRHRWVKATSVEADLDVSARPRPRTEMYDWADEQVNLPLDPEWGPAWRMGVQPFTDGSTVVSLVISHCIADGSGSVMACLEAMNGITRDLGYPPPRSRVRSRAVREDLRQVLRDLPEIARTARRAVTVFTKRRKSIARPAPALSAANPHERAHSATATVFIDLSDWDQCAEKLGGNSFSLVAGFAARIAAHLGRTRAEDGAVTLMLPVNERESLENTGGNVVSIANVSFAPEPVTRDLRGARTAIREALKQARAVPDEMIELAPLIPFVPKRGIAKMADVAFGFSTDLPISVSNFGDLPADIMRVDGTPADYLCFRGVDRHVSRATLERRGGILTLTAGRMAGKIALTAISYQPGRQNTQAELHEVISTTLGEFSLTGSVT